MLCSHYCDLVPCPYTISSTIFFRTIVNIETSSNQAGPREEICALDNIDPGDDAEELLKPFLDAQELVLGILNRCDLLTKNNIRTNSLCER